MCDTPSKMAACIMLAQGHSVEHIARALAIDPAAIAHMLDAPAPALVVLSTEATLRIGHPLPEGVHNGTDAYGMWS